MAPSWILGPSRPNIKPLAIAKIPKMYFCQSVAHQSIWSSPFNSASTWGIPDPLTFLFFLISWQASKIINRYIERMMTQLKGLLPRSLYNPWTTWKRCSIKNRKLETIAPTTSPTKTPLLTWDKIDLEVDWNSLWICWLCFINSLHSQIDCFYYTIFSQLLTKTTAKKRPNERFYRIHYLAVSAAIVM